VVFKTQYLDFVCVSVCATPCN